MNPFLKKGYLDGLSSLNKHLINGVKAYSYFNPRLISNEILKNNEYFGFDTKTNLLKQLDDILNDVNNALYDRAFEIIYEFGLRLAEIFEILDNPSLEQVENRPNWADEHWDYFKNVKKIYIAGGLVTDNFSFVFQEAYKDYKSLFGLNKEVVFIKNSSNLAIEGLAEISDRDTLLYDFGQTNVKAGTYVNGNLVLQESRRVKIDNQTDQTQYAKACDRFIIDLIKDDLIKYPNIKEVKIAISNYVHNGVIDPAPWHYGILHLIESNYERRLKDILNIDISLHHDTSSMGYYFERESKAILISLGTAFGLTFLD